MRVGLISDTHGLLRPQALAALQGSEHIVHGGDIGNAEVLEQLRAIAPLTVVRGNVDTDDWAQAIGETETIALAGVRIHVLHDLKALAIDPAALGVGVVVSGHSHKPLVEQRGAVLYVNPGSAGPRRFRLPVSVAQLVIEAGGAVTARIVELSYA
ncbi:metallophosphoesterase family protein [Caenimonas terrae]|uniref:Phosphoesterase n=1 Tax=Caenimonas terrae TaxID=696074 RepID=A0ABW0NML4_9BURK